jgi:hypothetical protein
LTKSVVHAAILGENVVKNLTAGEQACHEQVVNVTALFFTPPSLSDTLSAAKFAGECDIYD